MSRHRVPEIYSVSEVYDEVNLDTLRPMAKSISPDAPSRKTDVVPFLIRAMTDEDGVRRLYDKLGELPKAAIQEAVANPLGAINIDRFKAKYGQIPDRGTNDASTRLSLFFPLGPGIGPDDPGLRLAMHHPGRRPGDTIRRKTGSFAGRSQGTR